MAQAPRRFRDAPEKGESRGVPIFALRTTAYDARRSSASTTPTRPSSRRYHSSSASRRANQSPPTNTAGINP